MFRKWLKLEDASPNCRLDYKFAATDDGPAFFSLCIIAFPLIFFVVWLQVVHEPPFWVHLLTSFPLLAIGCAFPLQPVKGWVEASQFANKAQEAGTEQLWESCTIERRSSGMTSPTLIQGRELAALFSKAFAARISQRSSGSATETIFQRLPRQRRC